jgi:hypothetical protein
MQPALIVAILLLCGAVLLLLHHGLKHAQDPPDALVRKESCWQCCFFQRSDVSNHEVWILLCLSNGATILLMLSSATSCSSG